MRRTFSIDSPQLVNKSHAWTQATIQLTCLHYITIQRSHQQCDYNGLHDWLDSIEGWLKKWMVEVVNWQRRGWRNLADPAMELGWFVLYDDPDEKDSPSAQ